MNRTDEYVAKTVLAGNPGRRAALLLAAELSGAWAEVCDPDYPAEAVLCYARRNSPDHNPNGAEGDLLQARASRALASGGAVVKLSFEPGQEASFNSYYADLCESVPMRPLMAA